MPRSFPDKSEPYRITTSPNLKKNSLYIVSKASQHQILKVHSNHTPTFSCLVELLPITDFQEKTKLALPSQDAADNKIQARSILVLEHICENCMVCGGFPLTVLHFVIFDSLHHLWYSTCSRQNLNTISRPLLYFFKI